MLERLVRDPAVEEVRSVARRALVRPSGEGSGGNGSGGNGSGGNGPGGNGSGGEATARLVHTQADLNEPAARSALEGVDLLYHLAAQVWQSRGAAGPLQMRTANIEGTRNMLLARPGAFVFASSVSVYGAWPDNPLPMDETHRPRPNLECPYAQQKLASERACAELAGRWAVLRLSAVLGPNADARVARAVRAYRWAVPAVAGAGQALQWLDEGDAVEGLLAAGRSLVAWRRCRWPGAQPRAGRLAGPRRHGRAGATAASSSCPAASWSRMSELMKRLGITPFGCRPGGADRRSPRRLCRQGAPAPRVAADQNLGRGAGRRPRARLARLSAQPALARSER